jgi:hypothetical protein
MKQPSEKIRAFSIYSFHQVLRKGFPGKPAMRKIFVFDEQ